MIRADVDKNRLLGQKITRARLDAGLTQVEVAAMFGISGATYSRWESGKVSVRFVDLEQLAIIFDKPFMYFSEFAERTVNDDLLAEVRQMNPALEDAAVAFLRSLRRTIGISPSIETGETGSGLSLRGETAPDTSQKKRTETFGQAPDRKRETASMLRALGIEGVSSFYQWAKP